MTGAGTNSTMPAMEGGPAIVLVRPQLAVNIGMCARAMANFGLSDLRLVSPREGWPRTRARRKGAYAAAAGAVHLLEKATVFDSVEAAIADLNYVYATTARERGQLKRVVAPADAMPESYARTISGEKHGILFGPERTGLANEDIALADAVLTFPVNPAYASLNLAQAVLLCGYEWFNAGNHPMPFVTPVRWPAAERKSVLAFFEFLEGRLDSAGYFRPVSKRPVMQRNLRNLFHRMSMTEADVRSLWGMVVRLTEGPRGAVQTRKRVRQPAPSAKPPARDPEK